MNISSSQCGIGLNIENPRIRYRPSSDLVWMSLMTSGVKIRLCPRGRETSPLASLIGELLAWAGALQDQLPFARLQAVVVPQLAAAHELAERAGPVELVDPELPVDQLLVGRGELRLDAVHAQRRDLAADIDGPVVHRVAQAVAHVTADDLAAALQHEPGHRAGLAANDDRAALLVDPGARPDVPADHQVAAAQRRAGERAGVLVHQHDAGHHVLRGRPADPPGDVDLRAVDQPAAEVAEAARDPDPAAQKQAYRDRVAGLRVEHGHLGDALGVQQPAQLEVDLPDGQVGRVQLRGVPADHRGLGGGGVRVGQPANVVAPGTHLGAGRLGVHHLLHTITSPSYGSYVSISRSSTARIAPSSDASATMSSPW